MFENIKKTFMRGLDFQGRATRTEFWTWTIACFIINAILGALANIGTNQNHGPNAIGMLFAFLAGIFSLVILIPSLAVAFRRLHDSGKSGLFILVGLIPLVGEIALIVLELLPPTPEAEKYGPNPRLGY